MSNSNSRRNMGRQKMEMKKIIRESNLQVTFTKRCNGLFLKANELCTLCDAQVSLIVFSPANKLFSFGETGVDAVIDRYLMRDQPQNLGNMHFLEAHRNANVQELNEKMNEDQLDQFKLALENLKKNMLSVVERQNIADVDVDAAAAIRPPHFFTGGPSSSNNPLQPPPQQFPVYPPPPPPPPYML
ncbi:PREDICTED: agamous-like MADS-box protein AGL62 [Lupinus angustifolius]|uniref:agamous-like MADS-box protein AGL62 n=1 Tax=Lupinus angustifolius TaxID=3871 RepID=UPI00092FC404|nr:PREDICTED: agamous-like MADS-box protein AGL62 [Lupinus angustifolius]